MAAPNAAALLRGHVGLYQAEAQEGEYLCILLPKKAGLFGAACQCYTLPMSNHDWHHFQNHLIYDESLGFWLDTSRIHFEADFFERMEPSMQKAFAAMRELEAGALSNPDEKRRVGHYWLRAPELAPDAESRKAIEQSLHALSAFAADIHSARIRPEKMPRFRNVLLIGIGGSALGPQFVSSALVSPGDRMKLFFFDNTDPDGMDRTIDAIDASGAGLGETLTLIISKSGGTKETRNGMLEAEAAYARLGLNFGKHAVAITGIGSELDRYAIAQNFLARFAMWDWVGGRTSELSAVGLLPAALQGICIEDMLEGARAMDQRTRAIETRSNPAAMLALSWYSATGGAGKKDMVLLPYKDRLELFSRYLQQLVMESIGKQHALDGREVNQGLAVYGNKGSTDQHAYVQQLRDGIDNFFVTFIEVLRDRTRPGIWVEPGVQSGDYLSGFLQGTRKALWDRGRESISISIEEVSAKSIGMLIALYERTVGFYASLVGINAYHQPGVEAGKKAAQNVLTLQGRILQALSEKAGVFLTLDEIASACGAAEDIESVFWILRHLEANSGRGIRMECAPGSKPWQARYSLQNT